MKVQYLICSNHNKKGNTARASIIKKRAERAESRQWVVSGICAMDFPFTRNLTQQCCWFLYTNNFIPKIHLHAISLIKILLDKHKVDLAKVGPSLNL
jgi:hypothetical protein